MGIYIDEFVDDQEESLEHYGTPRHSGRYPWGSGKNPQRSKDLFGRIDELKAKGLSEKEIAEELKMNTSELRAKKALGEAAIRQDLNYKVQKMWQKGMSKVSIARELGISEGTVRNYIKNGYQQSALLQTVDILKQEVEKKGYIDVTLGSERLINVSQTRMKQALAALRDQGYAVNDIYIEQLGTDKKQKTTVQVLAKGGTTKKDCYDHMADIAILGDTKYDVDMEGNPIAVKIHKPKNVDKSRVMIRYAEEGGLAKDGVIELRRGVDDLDMGKSQYAQVRIAVDGDKYLKGMAVYADDTSKWPDGVDILFNTNKKQGTSFDSVLKAQKTEDEADPFGALIDRQNDYYDADGKRHDGALNIVREEGSWADWADTLASQMLSKQSTALAKQQLDLDYSKRRSDLDEIESISNAVVKKKLLDSFADSADAAAVQLKAAALPRQAYKVILPLTDIKDDEIYAPTYKDGEKVVLIRYPHGGKFEIPQLTVNNHSSKIAQKTLANATDAVGISSKVAEQLSGADFDGDTVLVIPNNKGWIQTQSPLKGLVGYDPKELYKKPPDAVKTGKGDGFEKQFQMGSVTNLITDMTMIGAPDDELERAVRHSMTIIDAEKHNLDWKRSAEDNAIADLKRKYQGGANAGASTLISKASSTKYVDERKEGKLVTDPETGKTKRQYIDPNTGEKLYEPTGRTIVRWDPERGERVDTGKKAQQKSTKMYEAKDAYELSSGRRMESIYAQYANDCKAMGNEARKETLRIQMPKRDPVAVKAYAKEVASLDKKLDAAERNKPYERKAQMVANVKMKALLQSDPTLSEDKDKLKKTRGKTLVRARQQVNPEGRYEIEINDREWEAIQANAISPSKLEKILNNADIDKVRARAIPRETATITTKMVSMAKAYARSGWTQAEIADVLGVSASSVSKMLKS